MTRRHGDAAGTTQTVSLAYNRQQLVTDVGSYVTNVTYTPLGQMDEILNGAGVTTDHAYSSTHLRLTALDFWSCPGSVDTLRVRTKVPVRAVEDGRISLRDVAMLHQAINTDRVLAGLAPSTWTDPTLTTRTLVRDDHFVELKTAFEGLPGAGSHTWTAESAPARAGRCARAT